MKSFNIFIALLFSFATGFSQTSKKEEKTIDVFYKYKTLEFSHTDKQLDSVYVQIEMLFKQYPYIMVTASATSEELKIDPDIDYKRAMKIIKYYTDKYGLTGFRFFIQPVLRKDIYEEDIYRNKTAFVNFYPIKLCKCK